MADTVKITERDIYNSILDGSFDIDVLKGFAEKKLAQLDHRNEKAKERAAKKRAESDELLDVVLKYVSDEPQSREDITNAMIADGHDVTAGKVGYRLTALSKGEDAPVVKQEATIPGVDGTKARRVMVYTLA